MGCGASAAEKGQVFHWHSKWGGADEPGQYVFGRDAGCIEAALSPSSSRQRGSPSGKQRGSFLAGIKQTAADAKDTMDEKARELALVRSRPSAKEFLLAAASGNAELVGQMLKDGALIDAVGSGVKTPLIVACEHGHALAAQVLIRQGANIYATCGESGATPLLLACALGVDAIVVELCANRIDLWPVRARVSSRPRSQGGATLQPPARVAVVRKRAPRGPSAADGTCPAPTASQSSPAASQREYARRRCRH